ncbi:MAG: UvrD-helicase domain-containing protein [Acidobacteria bacterium]|nr:UvrD-helicase domain-containing protein [Acidobacteriota bacterium]
MNFLNELNSQQREAVETVQGPVLILAGAGSGKTRAVTYRIASLIANGTSPQSILAVTFTNKAAGQMKERVSSLLARMGQAAGDPWVATFHSFCARLLRREAPRLGLPRDFAIYDDDDQTAVVKLALRRLSYEDHGHTPRQLLERISYAKNHSQTPEDLAADARDQKWRESADVFRVYQEVLRKSGALDFDDLLLYGVAVLRDHPEAREAWQQRFRFIHVDEYQDTNRVQYNLLRLLVGPHCNLCVVGDEDQSIYGWRGADVGNILRFAEDFPGARVIRLEQNYRSTQQILDAAGAVVAHNERRIGKTLSATRGKGPLLRYFEAADANAEADFVGGEIYQHQRSDPSQSIAVLYRTNFQSRAFEESLRRQSIRYRVVGGFSFYQRAEIKDALAYIRLTIQPDDDIAFLRVINTPPRGIGKTTVDALREISQKGGVSLWAALSMAIQAGKSVAPLSRFRDLMDSFKGERESLPPAEFLRHILDRTGYLDTLEQQDTVEDTARSENLRELVNAVAEGSERGETWEDFLDQAALVSDADNYDEHAPVTLMTLHSAKGLEFDHVFLAGLEEGLFPHSRSRNSQDELEEERRLCYVCMTRAKESLTLSRAVYRRIYGNDLLEASSPSRFLAEIPAELVETAEGSLADSGSTRRYEPDPEFADVQRHRRFRAQPEPEFKRPSPAPARSKVHASRRESARSAPGNSNPLVGVRVRHKTYGVGTIIGVEEDGDDRKLTVSFINHGAKKLIERYANLERV